MLVMIIYVKDQLVLQQAINTVRSTATGANVGYTDVVILMDVKCANFFGFCRMLKLLFSVIWLFSALIKAHFSSE